MTTPRRVRAGDVLRAIEEHGPASPVRMSVHFRRHGGRLWAALRHLASRGLVAGLEPDRVGGLDPRDLTPKGRALLAARRAKGRTGEEARS